MFNAKPWNDGMLPAVDPVRGRCIHACRVACRIWWQAASSAHHKVSNSPFFVSQIGHESCTPTAVQLIPYLLALCDLYIEVQGDQRVDHRHDELGAVVDANKVAPRSEGKKRSKRRLGPEGD